MKKFILLVLSICCCFNSLTAQDSIPQKFKIYKSWLYLNNQSDQVKGTLFEIKDSSILLSSSLYRQDYLTGAFRIYEIDAKNIDYLYVRNKNSIKAGSIIGAVGGIAIAMALTKDMTGSEFQGTTWVGRASFFGIFIVPACAGIGALVSLPRVGFPIGGNYGNFNKYRGKLQKYSVTNDVSVNVEGPGKAYNHKFYIGMTVGPSFPLGEFADKSTINENAGLAKTGGTGSIVAGYRVNNNIGVSATFSNSSFATTAAGDDTWWSVTGFAAGPVFSIFLGDKLFVSLKPGLGYTRAALVLDDIESKYGGNLGLSLNASLSFDFAERWSAFSETGYFTSDQKFFNAGEMTLQKIDLDFGIFYRFL
jgi:hypothetical protein